MRLPADEARALAACALLASGALAEVAEVVAAHVVDAELAGHPSHGLRQIPIYCANAGSPGNDLTVWPEIVDQTQSLTTVDAHAGLGHPALALAVDNAAAGAREAGIAAAAVIRCGHAGRAGAWVERGAAQDCVTIVLLGGTTPPFAMVAAPGAAPALHTNPIAIGAPASGSPLLLDIATSMVAAGKVAGRARARRLLARGRDRHRDGRRSSDPAEIALGGALLPVGGHKGFGLSALVEALSVSLTGADGAGCDPQEGALVICIDGAAFRPAVREVVASLDALRARLRDSSGPGVPVLAPGDPEARGRSAAAAAWTWRAPSSTSSRSIASRAHPRRGRRSMKITAVDTFLVRPRWVFVRDADRRGHHRLGRAGWRGARPGRDRRRAGHGQLPRRAESAADRAPLADAHEGGLLPRRGDPLECRRRPRPGALGHRRQAHGVPVHELLGGPTRDRMRVYAWIGGDRTGDYTPGRDRPGGARPDRDRASRHSR